MQQNDTTQIISSFGAEKDIYIYIHTKNVMFTLSVSMFYMPRGLQR